MKLVNLTGHDLRLGNSSTLLRSKGRARVRGDMHEAGTVEISGVPSASLPILEVEERAIEGLPAPQKDTLYIVSGIVASAAKRADVVAPSRVERSGNGRVSACHAFVRPRTM